MLTITNRIDMYPGAVPLTIHVGQYDSDFALVFELYSSAGEFVLETGTTAMIRGTKTDGNAYDADAAIDIAGKLVTVSGDQQMTAAAGRNRFELVLLKNSKVLTTANFILNVERAAMNADTIASESVLKELNAIIAGAETATEAAQTATAAAQSVSGSTAQIATNTANIATNTADINNLKADLNDIDQKEKLTGWVEGKYIGTSGSTANPFSPTSDNSYRYIYIEASSGDVFTINATGGSTPRTWAFIDSSNNVLAKAIANLTCNDVVITAPESTAHLIINDKKTGNACYKGIGIAHRVSDLESKGDVLNAVVDAKCKVNLTDGTWELGLINNQNGKYQASTSRICTPAFIDVTGLTEISYNCTQQNIGVTFSFYSDDNEASWIESSTGWLYGSGTVEVKGKFVRLCMSANSVSSATKLEAFAYNPIIEKINEIAHNAMHKNTAYLNPVHGIAHMGNAGNAYNDPPAQTGLNYINASKKGYKYVEGDVRFTSDGIGVLNHDNDVSLSYTWYYAGTDTRVSTAGEVLISNKTYADLRNNYDVRRAAGNYITKVLSFEDWIIICKKLNLYPYIELKNDAGYTAEQIKNLVNIVKLYEMQDNCAWFAVTTAELNMVLTYHPSARVGYATTNDADTTKIATAASLKTQNNEVWVQYRYTNVTNAIINEAKSVNMPIIVWTVDTETDMLALDNYISGVLSNTLNYADVVKNSLYAELS